MVVVLTLLVAAGCAGTTGTVSRPASTSTWSAPVPIGGQSLPADERSVYGVSCPSANFCLAVDESGSAHSWRNGRWSVPQPTGATGTLTSVSCPTATDCVAVSFGGTAITYRQSTWSVPSRGGTGGHIPDLLSDHRLLRRRRGQ